MEWLRRLRAFVANANENIRLHFLLNVAFFVSMTLSYENVIL